MINIINLINLINKIDLIYIINDIKYNFDKNVLNIKYRIKFKNRALKRAYNYIYNNQPYGNIKWN
tara:strand:+ start:55 stop:249 length:195 start_codon:yes stop_codon:yes gene_type:complete